MRRLLFLGALLSATVLTASCVDGGACFNPQPDPPGVGCPQPDPPGVGGGSSTGTGGNGTGGNGTGGNGTGGLDAGVHATTGDGG
jgi:hypothetical protein